MGGPELLMGRSTVIIDLFKITHKCRENHMLCMKLKYCYYNMGSFLFFFFFKKKNSFMIHYIVSAHMFAMVRDRGRATARPAKALGPPNLILNLL